MSIDLIDLIVCAWLVVWALMLVVTVVTVRAGQCQAGLGIETTEEV